jgi:hypothetical protein
MNWRSTKFMQSAFVQITGAIGLFVDKVDAGTYVALSTLALSIYAVADVVQRKVTNEAQNA